MGGSFLACDDLGKKLIGPVSTSSRLIWCFSSFGSSGFHIPRRNSRRLELIRRCDHRCGMLCWPRRATLRADCRRNAQILKLLGRVAACLRMKARGGPTSQIGSATQSPADDRLSLFLDLRQVDSLPDCTIAKSLPRRLRVGCGNKKRTKSTPHWLNADPESS
jgi:hypothetical protein